MLIKPAIGGALISDEQAYAIDMQFFDDPVTREEVCVSKHGRAKN